MAAGNPVIANIDEGKYPIITRYGCGKVVKAGSSKEYAKGIEYFLNLNADETEQYKAHALETARLFDTDEINRKWQEIMARCLERNDKTKA